MTDSEVAKRRAVRKVMEIELQPLIHEMQYHKLMVKKLRRKLKAKVYGFEKLLGLNYNWVTYSFHWKDFKETHIEEQLDEPPFFL